MKSCLFLYMPLQFIQQVVFKRQYFSTCFTYQMVMMVVVFVVCNLIVDLLNAALDPRIRRHEGAHA